MSIKIPFVPSKQEIVKKLTEIYIPRPNERVVDLGSGDARVLISIANKYDDVRLFGIEKDPLLINIAHKKIRRCNLLDNISINKQDIFHINITRKNYDTIYAYLTNQALTKLEPKLMKFIYEGGLLILNDFKLPNLKPDLIIPVRIKTGTHYIYVYGNKNRLSQIII